MSMESALGRITEIQSRMREVEKRVEELPNGRFGASLDAASKPARWQPTQGGTPSVGPASAVPLPAGPLPSGLGRMVADAAQRNQLDPALLQAVVKTESNGNPNATSPVGAMGLMQLMPQTAADLGVAHPYDAQENLEGGAKYLKDLTSRFGLANGVAAYNAGPGAVQSHGGVPPYPETQHYVEKVLTLYDQFKK